MKQKGGPGVLRERAILLHGCVNQHSKGRPDMKDRPRISNRTSGPPHLINLLRHDPFTIRVISRTNDCDGPVGVHRRGWCGHGRPSRASICSVTNVSHRAFVTKPRRHDDLAWRRGTFRFDSSSALPYFWSHVQSAGLPLGFLPPCLPIKAPQPPTGDTWLHEIKLDGFRVIARKNGERVRLYSRPGNDLTQRFPLLADALAALKSHSCIIDGEAVAVGPDGVPSFERLRYRRRDTTTSWPTPAKANGVPVEMRFHGFAFASRAITNKPQK